MQNDALTTELAACASPETLLATIFKHHPDLQAPVPVEPLALEDRKSTRLNSSHR